MADVLTDAISQRICTHMNEDHADAVVLYAKAFGGVSDVSSAEMVHIDSTGMDLMVYQAETTIPVRILFDHELQDSEDAHQTLIAMVKQARQQS